MLKPYGTAKPKLELFSLDKNVLYLKFTPIPMEPKINCLYF